MKYAVVYTSKTGNTKKIAQAIFDGIPDENKDVQELTANTGTEIAETYFVGFWINRGTCSIEMMDFLSNLHGKNVALFATCGLGANKAYYSSIEAQLHVLIPDDNIYLGCFFCQGKMPIQVRNRYEEQLAIHPDDQRLEAMIQNFDRAMLHPDEEDAKAASEFAVKTIEKNAL